MLGKSQAILFDEPTSGLDPESRRLLWNVMLALFQRSDQDNSAAGSYPRRSCVLTSHSLEEAEALCSRVAILLRGEIFAVGIEEN